MSRCGPAVLALVGLRCTGKSTVGAQLAAAVGASFVDLDDRIAEAAGAASAGAVIEAHGIATFREIEERELARALVRTGAGRVVLATGGGAVESAASRDRLRRDALTVWLRAPVDVLVARMRADPALRPSLTGAPLLEEFRELDARRAPLYREVSRRAFDVGTRSAEEVAIEVERVWLA